MTRTSLNAICGLIVAFAAGGCASFPGEWLEEGTVNADGTISPVEGERRAALRFEWPSTVRYGAYDNLARVVDHQAVQSDTYFTMQWGRVVQFGAVKARLQDKNTLNAYIGGEITRRFRRVKGDSIFPPVVILPSLAKQQQQQPVQPIDPLLAPVEPALASAEAVERDL